MPLILILPYLNNGNPFKDYVFDPRKISKKALDYLEKILELCRKEGVRVVFVTAPLAPTTLSMIKNYRAIHEFFNDFARRNNVTYIDYNVLEDYKSLFTDQDFKDCDHLNVGGVIKFDTDFLKRMDILSVKITVRIFP